MRKNYFKNTGIAVVAAAMVLGAAGTAMAEESTATASAPGVFGEDVVVEVTATPDEIVSVEVVEHNETDGIGSTAVDSLPGEIVAA